MERQDVMEAYGLKDPRRSPDLKQDSKVTEAGEEELSYRFQSSLLGDNPVLAKLCGRELTIEGLGMQQTFTLGFWATHQSIYKNGHFVGFRIVINDYQSH